MLAPSGFSDEQRKCGIEFTHAVRTSGLVGFLLNMQTIYASRRWRLGVLHPLFKQLIKFLTHHFVGLVFARITFRWPFIAANPFLRLFRPGGCGLELRFQFSNLPFEVGCLLLCLQMRRSGVFERSHYGLELRAEVAIFLSENIVLRGSYAILCVKFPQLPVSFLELRAEVHKLRK